MEVVVAKAMWLGRRAPSFALLIFTCSLNAQHSSRTAVIHGPHGLEGWKREVVVETLENQGPLPVELILARNGHVIRRIKNDQFIWTWMFRADGRQVAYETGPLHFSLTCVLADIVTGKQLAAYDCFADPLAPDAPVWVKDLEAKAHAPSDH